MHIPRLYLIGCNTLIFLALLSFKPVHGQQYFENPLILKPSDGLSLHNIWDVANDNRGFLWIGGTNGLLRYDGQYFKELRHDPNDTTTILDGTVSIIYYEEEEEKLWLGHWGGPGGISVLDLHTEKVKWYPYDPMLPSIILAKDFYWIYQDRFGQIWAGTRQNGMVKYNEKQDNFELFSYKPSAGDDGYTLCHRLKHHDLTNHIPVILLTARATDANRIEGVGQGADAYLIKPFDPEELLIRMEQLLRQRAALKKKYWPAARIRRLEDLDLAPEAQTFVERLDDCIFQNLAGPKFKVDQLAAAMFMSRTSLLKEMKKHVGKPPSQYINRARLDLADQLLRETNLTIAAIARQSGFSSDSYFTKKYEAAFGRTPSEQRRLIGEREDSIQ